MVDPVLNGGFGEHSGVSPLSREKSNTETTTAVNDRMLFCDVAVSLKDFKTLAKLRVSS